MKVRIPPGKTGFYLGILLSMFAMVQVACAGGSDEEGRQQSGFGQSTVTRTVIANPEEMQDAFMEVADEVLPSVVEVNVLQIVDRQPSSIFEYFFGTPEGPPQQRPGLGSGVLVRKNGDTVYVVTNYHVVQEADEISVVLMDGRDYDAAIVGGDQRTDLALLEFTASEDLPVATLADSDLLSVGSWVLAMGNPYGFESTVTAGIVSALGRTAQAGVPIGGFTEYIQTDAAINPGNSGGALVNLDGEIVGINAWIASQSGGSTGVGFAIPSNVVSTAIEDFIDEGRIIYGWLGVTSIDPSSQAFSGLEENMGIAGTEGVLIDNVHLGSPAANAGMLPGDFVTEVNGVTVDDALGFSRQVGGKRPGTEVSFSLIRYEEEQSMTVSLGERPAPEELQDPSQLWPGVNIIPISDRVRNQSDIPDSVEGVIAIRVISESPVAIAGIRRGDIITGINDTDTPDALAFYRALNDAGDEASFEINRQGRSIGISVSK